MSKFIFQSLAAMIKLGQAVPVQSFIQNMSDDDFEELKQFSCFTPNLSTVQDNLLDLLISQEYCRRIT